MIPNKINLFGFSISRAVFLAVAVAVLLLVFKLTIFFKNMFKKITDFLGITEDKSETKNQEDIAKSLAKDPAVKSQMTISNKQKAESIHEALSQILYDEDLLIKTFESITGPNQMKAISLAYGTRSMFIWPLNIEGTLPTVVRKRLLNYDLKKKHKYPSSTAYWTIESKLNQLTK